ncbi:hypothetical protein M434DRAFT_274948 [Hypoxylon sp. CO27-5]|nr:hypothetical protein M434DRAFT_274948 [Hypoxylon sp. CO27-5]
MYPFYLYPARNIFYFHLFILFHLVIAPVYLSYWVILSPTEVSSCIFQFIFLILPLSPAFLLSHPYLPLFLMSISTLPLLFII